MNDKSYTGTPVCHYYTKEWIKMGYNVRVVHFESLFPRPYYIFGKIFNNFIKAKTGCVVYTKTPRQSVKYSIDNVPVLLIPMRKMIPHSRFPSKVINEAVNEVRTSLAKDDFIPDIITAHFLLPQLEMLFHLKKIYPKSKTCMVLHSDGSTISKIYPNYVEYMKSVDAWGFRSYAFKERFEIEYGEKKKTFICYSGIPEEYITGSSRDFSKGVKQFIFVGSLYKLKRVEDSIIALNDAFTTRDFTFDIVGSGAEKSNLISLVNQLHLQNQIHFHGQLPRYEAQKKIQESDCFIMVSSHEAFGLVYVEAMAKGCIVIATKGQGIDGIIKDGVNGFLCDAMDTKQLCCIIKNICLMSPEKLSVISNNAIQTAKNMTDRKAAEHYIDSIE